MADTDWEEIKKKKKKMKTSSKIYRFYTMLFIDSDVVGRQETTKNKTINNIIMKGWTDKNLLKKANRFCSFVFLVIVIKWFGFEKIGNF